MENKIYITYDEMRKLFELSLATGFAVLNYHRVLVLADNIGIRFIDDTDGVDTYDCTSVDRDVIKNICTYGNDEDKTCRSVHIVTNDDKEYIVSLSVPIPYEEFAPNKKYPMRTFEHISDIAILDYLIDKTKNGGIDWNWYDCEEDYSDGIEYNAYNITHDYYAIIDCRWILHMADHDWRTQYLHIVDTFTNVTVPINTDKVSDLINEVKKYVSKDRSAKAIASLEDLIKH